MLFSGTVQGVFFRRTVSRHAVSLGLKGWVRNLTDGRVEALVVADSAVLDLLIDRCRTENDAARVDTVKTRVLPDEDLGERFEVKPTAERPL